MKAINRKINCAITVICLLMFGCHSQANRTAFLEEYLTVADEIVRMVDSNPTTEGVKQAQTYLDSKKVSLKTKFEAGKKESPDKEMMEKFSVIITGQVAKVSKLPEKHPVLKNELENLARDFGEFLLK